MVKRLAEVNGETGIIAIRNGRPNSVMVLLVRGGLVSAIYSVADERKLAHVRLPAVSDPDPF